MLSSLRGQRCHLTFETRLIIRGEILCSLLWDVISLGKVLVVRAPLRLPTDIILSVRDFSVVCQDKDLPKRLLSWM